MKTRTYALSWALCGALLVALPIAGCNSTGSATTTPATTAETVTKAAASAEASLTIAAKGLTTAVQLGAIKSGSSTALAAKTALDAAGKVMDAAEAYIVAGNYSAAQTQIKAAQNTAADVDKQTGTVDATVGVQ